MGCCFSKIGGPQSTPPPSFHPSFAESANFHVKAPLPPVMEEETVKEVLSLSEIPSSKHPSPQSFSKIEELDKKRTPLTQSSLLLPKIEEEKKTQSPQPLYLPKAEEMKKNAPYVAEEEASDVSEICSLSESGVSTITEKREDDSGEVQQRVVRSPAKIQRKRSNNPNDFISERGRNESPARRSEPSPSRRNRNTNNNNAVQNRDLVEGHQTDRRWNNGSSRRDPRESPARRSRSPAKRAVGRGNAATVRPGMSHSPSKRAVGHPSPARKPETASSTHENNVLRRLEDSSTNDEEENRSNNETIENPHVSLECFIFL
ncbi:hypothetical protein GIB67_025055 [Kingdonia uniflora]|uniref:Uncharacterized protein n=1 Tax=Kingdonia uniflora TaxID=39325 RepID=A0A7J7N7I3_9MAGN|nr:hypothetical protein GIB67_025055 [Kingdonia uniflora]